VAPPGQVSLDLGRCVACGLCTAACPTGTITPSRSTEVAVRQRADLVLSNQPSGNGPADALPASPLRRSLHYRAISTGDNATDLEAAATHNPIFDASRFGIHGVASPRHADALLVTGPVGRAMQEPLRRCYEAMPEPRLVIAAGAAAISGGVHSGGYAQACGVDSILPVSIYIPGHPPHPWMLLHGLLVAMGRMAPARLGAGKATAAVLERPPARDTR
jgi:Ni,Fe-hydrogenase III small subunit